jgi:hypothetical protein
MTLAQRQPLPEFFSFLLGGEKRGKVSCLVQIHG